METIAEISLNMFHPAAKKLIPYKIKKPLNKEPQLRCPPPARET